VSPLHEIPPEVLEDEELDELVELEELDVVEVQTGSGTPRLTPHISDKQHSRTCPEQTCVAFAVGHIGVMPLQHNLLPLAQYALSGFAPQNPPDELDELEELEELDEVDELEVVELDELEDEEGPPLETQNSPCELLSHCVPMQHISSFCIQFTVPPEHATDLPGWQDTSPNKQLQQSLSSHIIVGSFKVHELLPQQIKLFPTQFTIPLLQVNLLFTGQAN
jgi:hypothetical protein